MQKMHGRDGRHGRHREAAAHLLASTRGRILLRLCRGRYTVADLAAHVGLTDNAVRAQLQRLQRDGMVSQAGARRGTRKPHVEYQLTTRARELFPRAYEPALRRLVDVLTDRLPPRVARDLLLRAGRALLNEHVGELNGRNPGQRLAKAMTRLNGNGLGIEATKEAGKITVRSCGCPLASVTAAHPE